MIRPNLTTDQCLKCNICTSACPVASVTDNFLGPKAVGPQAARFRNPHRPPSIPSLAYCSGCGICSLVCPHGVAVAEINIQAKSDLVNRGKTYLRDHLISRPELLGRLASPVATLANKSLSSRPTRWLLEKTLALNSGAPLPTFASQSLRAYLRSKCVDRPPDPGLSSDQMVAFFHGCSSNYYEPELGILAVTILEQLGQRVIIPPQKCCGLPLQSNGFIKTARRYAQANISWLAPFARRGIPIVGIATSCTLSLKHDYRIVLGLQNDESNVVASSTFDFFEFLTYQLADEISKLDFKPLIAEAIYHPPCQLRSHGIGFPALKILQRIPGLQLHLSESECCGIAGTYGIKQEKSQVAYEVGKTLFEQAQQSEVDFLLSDSETCRWWINKHTGLPVYHPLEIMAQAMGIV
jgi:glycerol-3-phosphate dehydrogenase subunit C